MLPLSHFPCKHVKAWSWNVMPEKATQVVLVHAAVSMPCWRAYQHVTNILSFRARQVLFLLLSKPQRQEHPASPTSHKSWDRHGDVEREKPKSHQAAQRCWHYGLGPSHACRSSHDPTGVGRLWCLTEGILPRCSSWDFPLKHTDEFDPLLLR